MAYLFIALLFLLVGFIFSMSSAIMVGLEKITWTIMFIVFTLTSYVASFGFGLVWIVWIIKNI